MSRKSSVALGQLLHLSEPGVQKGGEEPMLSPRLAVMGKLKDRKLSVCSAQPVGSPPKSVCLPCWALLGPSLGEDRVRCLVCRIEGGAHLSNTCLAPRVSAARHQVPRAPCSFTLFLAVTLP